MNEVESAAAAHRRGELDVDAQLIFGDDVGRGEDLRHLRCRRGVFCGQSHGAGDRCSARCGKRDLVLASVIEREHRRETDASVFDRILADHRRLIGTDRNLEHRRPRLTRIDRAELDERGRWHIHDIDRRPRRLGVEDNARPAATRSAGLPATARRKEKERGHDDRALQDPHPPVTGALQRPGSGHRRRFASGRSCCRHRADRAAPRPSRR